MSTPSTNRPLAALQLEGLGKDYGPVRALGALSLSIPPGEVYGLLGPNGAGKTTALRSVLGFVSPDRGRARVFGTDVTQDPVAAREAIGYLPGEVRLDPRPTGGQLLEQLGELRPPFDPAYRAELIERLQLDPSKRVRTFYELITELTAAGSAVLFSSHVLAEVSVTCARVGVLRDGDLVFEKSIAQLEAEAIRRVEVVFAAPTSRVCS